MRAEGSGRHRSGQAAVVGWARHTPARLPRVGRRGVFLQQGLEQGGPAAEAEPLREEAQLLEELAPGACQLAAAPPPLAGTVLDLVQREREQVQRREQVGEALAAVPEVALEVVAVARQAVEPFVLDLPAGAADPCDLRHVVGRDLQAGEERVRVGALAVTLDHELDPAAQYGGGAVAERHSVQPAVAVPLDLLLVVAGLDPAAGMDEVVMQHFVQALVGTGLADEDEVRPEVVDELAEGLVLFFSLFQWILPNYSMNSSGRCSNWFTTAGENWGRVKAL